MGVDCRITLPAAARIDDVADVIGALAGLPCGKRYFGNGHEGYSAHTEGVTVKPSSLPECAAITLKPEQGKLIDGELDHYVMYHFEGGRKGERLLAPPSTAFWIAVGCKLVDFFGGSLEYSDCDDKVNYSQPEQPHIHAEDGREWYALQARKLAVQPLTRDELTAAVEYAAYK